MELLTGHRALTRRRGKAFGGDTHENDAVLSRLCFVTEGQRYPDHFRACDAVTSAPMLAIKFAGFELGVVSERCGPSGVWVLSVGGMVGLGGLTVLMSWLDVFPPVGQWLVDQSVTTLAVELPLALAAVITARRTWACARRSRSRRPEAVRLPHIRR